MSIGTILFLIFLIIIGSVMAWYFLVRRPASRTTATPLDTDVPAPAQSTPRGTYIGRPVTTAPQTPVFFDPAPRGIADQRPVFVETYNNPTNDLANLIIAEEILEEIREEHREDRLEEMREERREERFEQAHEERYEPPANDAPQEQYREPDRYEAPVSYDAPDTGGGWDSSGDFGSGDSGSF